MKTITPKLDGCCVECPVYDGEWMVCNVTQSKCPMQIEDDEGDYDYRFPFDCPARRGIKVKIDFSQK
jgi:hypothetical protein